MKTLFIHIGTPKTGTTSIQRFCVRNEPLLKQRSYCYPLFKDLYPESTPSRNGYFLVGVVKDEHGNRCIEKEDENFRKGLATIKELFQEYDNIVLSDEKIWRSMDLFRTDLWETLKQEGEKEGFDIRVIVYLRRQDQLICSLWNQSVKSLHTMNEKTLKEYMDSVNLKLRLDYYTKLERIASVLGKDHMVVRRFDRERFYGGNIYSDFLDAIGLVWSDEFNIKQDVRNQGLSPNIIELKRILNSIPDSSDSVQQEFIYSILRICSDVSSDRYPCAMLSRDEALEFLETYEEGNQKIAREYLQDENSPLFSTKIKDLPKWQPDNEHMMEDIVRLIGVSNLRLLEENLKLREEFENFRYKVKHPFYALSEKLKRKHQPKDSDPQ